MQLRFNRPPTDGGLPTMAAVSSYTLWRRIPGTALLDGPSSATDARRVVSRGSLERVRLDPLLTGGTNFPPGSWEALGSQPAMELPTYTFAAPTHDDSTAAGPTTEVFVITTHTSTPSLYVVGPPDSGHSVDNLPPAQPQNLAGEKTGPTTASLHWSPNGERDISGYSVFKGTSPDFVPSPENHIGSPTGPAWTDPAFEPGTSHYKGSARDRHGNPSAFALLLPSEVTAAGDPGAATVSFLGRPIPNPARSRVTVEYGLVQGGHVVVAVVDLRGRVVTRLENRDVDAGIHRRAWDGRDPEGRRIGPGVYWVTLAGPGIRSAERLVLLE